METVFDETAQYAPSESVTEGRSQDELISEFVKVDTAVRELQSQKRELAMALAGLAFEHRGEQNTVRVQSSDGTCVKVEFGVEFEYDNAQMFTAAELLGKAFEDLFETKIEFKPKKRSLKLFMNTVPSSEKERTAQDIIRSATTVKAKTPYVAIDR